MEEKPNLDDKQVKSEVTVIIDDLTKSVKKAARGVLNLMVEKIADSAENLVDKGADNLKKKIDKGPDDEK